MGQAKKQKRMIIPALTVAFIGLGASECAYKKVPDISSVFAAEANDKTVIIEGCGSQPVVGYTYCRKREGAPTDGKVTLIAPPVECGKESCVSFEVFFPDGSPTLGLSLPAKATRLDVSWKDLTKTEAFQKNQRGFWPVVMRWKWISAVDSKEYESFAEGEIRLRVTAANYLSLHESREDPNFVWKWSEGKTQFRMTTAGRAATWKE